MTNQNGIKCYKSVSCILSILVIAFIFGAICIDLAWTKPSLRQDISQINRELVITNQKIDKLDSMQAETNDKFIQMLDRMNQSKYQK